MGFAARLVEPSLQATLDALNCPVALLDESGRIVGASLSWRSLACGVTGAIGDNYLDVCHERANEVSGAAVLGKGVARVLHGGHATFERVCRHLKDSKPHDYRIRIKRLRHCAPNRYLLSHEEVTELTEAQDLAREASERVCEVQSEERQRLAEELHDSVGQNLVSMGLGLARLRMITPQTESVTTVMGDLSAALREAHAQIRTISYLLHPPWPEEAGGLEVAVRQFVQGFAQRADLRADVRLHGPPCVVDRERELALFRILQEGLVNIHRHAHANVVLVELHNRGAEIALQVRDDGSGFAAPEGLAASPGVGLLGIRARIKRFGGEVRIDTGPTGTTLMVRLPTAKPSTLRARVDM